MEWGTGPVIWTIVDFGFAICFQAGRERSEGVLNEVIGEQERGDYALIAWIRGPMPRMFMTRVRL